AGSALILSGFIRLHFLFQPNFLDTFFWALATYMLIRLINSSEKKYFYWLGLTIGLGWQAKNSILFIAAAICLAIILTKNRKWLLEPHFYGAILLSLLIMAPNIWWQYQHRWPLVHHMETLQEEQLRFIQPIVFLAEQILAYLPV